MHTMHYSTRVITTRLCVNSKWIDDILNKLYIYRSQIKGDFEQKVEAMNKVTENLIEEHD
jgi:hypothetical protein